MFRARARAVRARAALGAPFGAGSNPSRRREGGARCGRRLCAGRGRGGRVRLSSDRRTTMPEMHFKVQWPSGATEDCYSPSWVIEEYLAVGKDYPVTDFVSRVRAALNVASDRVRQK